MPNLKIEIADQQVTAAFNRLLAAGERPGEWLDAVGRILKTRDGRARRG